MKKNILIAAMSIFGVCTVFAQPNLDLESWTGNDPDGWITFNGYDTSGAPQSTFQDTTFPGEGLSSAKITTVYWPGGLLADTLGGLLSLGGDLISMGIPYAKWPVSIDFLYKANIVPGDMGAVMIQLSHWDGVQTVMDAQANFTISGAPVQDWTPVTLPFNYITTEIGRAHV